MDNPRHRQILRALRPHGADARDPDAQDALAAARADAALGAWLEREQIFDRAFAERVQAAAVPADLRTSIFAAAGRLPPPARQRGPRLRLERPVATLFFALAAAASFALVIFLAVPKNTGRVGIDDVIAAAADATIDSGAHELPGHALAELRGWFAAKAAPVPGEIPTALARLQTDGAGVVVLKGITTSVVTFDAPAFSTDASGGAVARRLSLFTVPRRSCSNEGISRQPTVQEHHGRSLAVWRDAASIYILAVDAPAETLRRFLGLPTPAVAWAPRPAPLSNRAPDLG